jgi:hypothetical protein
MIKIWYQKNRKGAAAYQKDEKISYWFHKQYYKSVKAGKKFVYGMDWLSESFRQGATQLVNQIPIVNWDQ